MKFLLLSFLAGVAVAFGFAPIGWWPLTILAFAGLLWLVESAPTLRSALARGWWFGVGQFVLGLNWIATAFTFQAKMPEWLGWVSVVVLSLYLAVYPAMAAGLAWRFQDRKSLRSSRAKSRGDDSESDHTPFDFAQDERGGLLVQQPRIGLVLILAAAWIVTEWLRATVFTGFAWNPVAVALVPTGAADTARLIGTYGLSGVVVLLGGVVWLVTRKARRPAAALFGGVVALILVTHLVDRAPVAGEGLPVRIVQPDIGQQDRWREGFEAENFRRLAVLTGAPSASPRLLLWPESAIVEPMGDNRPLMAAEISARHRQIARLLGPGDLLLTGGITVSSPDGYRVTTATNSVFAMDATGRVLARFDKAHLVPYGEYLPMRPLLSAIGLSRLAPGDLDYIPGPGAKTFDFGAYGAIGFQLCYEIIFSGQVVDPAARPDFIFNPSNDAWFGSFGPPQHLAQARLRAIEEGLPVIRATPTGISAIVDADGRVVESLPWRQAGVIDGRIPAAKPPTLFAMAGNILPFVFAGLLVAIAFALRRRSR